MIYLRELRVDDAPLMLEWMHDKDIQKNFKKNMLNVTLEKAEKFCENAALTDSISNGQDVHFAITDETDKYLGTISLKNIDLENLTAEFAISTRKVSHGKGIAKSATGLLLKKAFTEYGLHRIYLTVFADNDSAIHMYERCGFKFEGELREHILRNNKFVNWKVYGILDSEYDEKIFAQNNMENEG